MRMIGICGAALLVLAGPAAAQEEGSVTCAESFEGAILGCEEEVPAAGWLEAPAEASETLAEGEEAPADEGEALADRVEPTAGGGGILAQAEAPEDEAWLERHPVGEPVEPGEAELLEEADLPDLPAPEPGRRYAEIDGRIVELDPESWELLQVIRRSAGVGEPAEAEVEVIEERPGRARREEERERRPDREARGRQNIEIPPGHLPPPGSCRVWFPDRPAGHQPPPTSCEDVEVPRGAALIRG